jgi:exodeoxyribonuclease V alpha subunit
MTTNLASLDTILESPCFNPIDRHFSRLMLHLAGKDSPELALAAALVSRQLADGHSCISLKKLAERPYPDISQSSDSVVMCPPAIPWEQVLRESGVVGHPDDVEKPLILDPAGRLYLQRYWQYEQAIAQDLLTRVQGPALILDTAMLRAGLERLFPPTREQPNWQKVAVVAAMHRRFCVLTGGPGTGKTWTVARVLALLLEQPGSARLKIKLAAPTGKAAARLQESLAQSLETLDCSSAVKARLQAKDMCTTLHRLLGTIPNSASFRHGKDNPLLLDVLVIDESSMVSLSLMAKVLAALKQENIIRLLLVGDKDQLPAIDPGGVLGDICRAASINQFSPAFRQAYLNCTGEELAVNAASIKQHLADAVVQLQVNHRVDDAAVLSQVSAQVNAGLAADVNRLLVAAGPAGCPVAWQPLPERRAITEAIRQAVITHYLPLMQMAGPREALEALGCFRILCAVREGPYGMLAINRLVEEILAKELSGLGPKILFGSYPGKPVMVTANNYTLKLFNGDTGVFWNTAGGKAFVHFPSESGAVRAIARERLPENETAYAMTVHKSQGSEFDHILMILPDKDNPLLTRELVYTALTRAKRSVRILSDLDLLSRVISRQAHRESGLTEALTGQAPGSKVTVRRAS